MLARVILLVDIFVRVNVGSKIEEIIPHFDVMTVNSDVVAKSHRFLVKLGEVGTFQQ